MTTTPAAPTVSTTATKVLAEVPVLDRTGPTAEVTTAVVTVLGRYRVDLSEDLTAAVPTLTDVIVRRVRTTAYGLDEAEVAETSYDPDEFAVLAATIGQAAAALNPDAVVDFTGGTP